MSNARYCVTCGKKYYPKSYNSYPEDDYNYSPDYNERMSFIVQPEHKRFHSLGCMKEFIAKNSIAFANLVDSVSQNNIQGINNQTIEKG
tara:strand:+ start:287 stop:553 length:267 start_codon:yes stop_codon:yes gene_type:complete